MIPPVTYQGGKQRLARILLTIINPPSDQVFHDLCCGSGAISVELVNRGHDPRRIVMLDKGPWGAVWQLVGEGVFDLQHFGRLCSSVPRVKSDIPACMESLAQQPFSPYTFLLLQASAFGGKAIWYEGGRWHNLTFRSYWQPTATSKRRSPVNPMMPMPDTLLDRMVEVCKKMVGVRAIHGDITEFTPGEGPVYIDPPYAGTTGYGYSFDVQKYVRSLGRPCFVSEGVPLGQHHWRLSEGRAKGGISGERKIANTEWLSLCP